MKKKSAFRILNKTYVKRATLLFMVLFLVLACAQSVPKKANDDFLNKFMGARNIEWKKESKKGWMVSFYMEKFHYMTAHYAPSGSFKDFEIEVHGEDIPEELVEWVHKLYPNASITSVYEINALHTTGYIIEAIDDGWLFGVQLEKGGDMKIIPKDDFRFQSRIKIEND